MFNLTRQEQAVIIFLIVVIFIGLLIHWFRENKKNLAIPVVVSAEDVNITNKIKDANIRENIQQEEEEKIIVVDVSGAVRKPGVYKLPIKSRVIDAIQIAGDTVGQADLSELNLARKLEDGEKIFVPFSVNVSIYQKETLQSEKIQPREEIITTEKPKKININTASVQELDSLPGIGPVIAKRIVEYRLKFGKFRRIEDIKNVKGIGEKKFNDIRNLITVN